MNVIKSAKTHIGELLVTLGEIAVGVLLVVNPVYFTSIILIALGVVMSAWGGMSIMRYVKTEPHAAAREYRLAKGLFLIGAGLFCVLRVQWIVSVFPALTMLYGAGMLVLGFIRIQHTVDLLRMKRELWFIAGIGAAVTLLIAGVVFVNPFESARLLWAVISTALFADALCALLSLFLKKKTTA